MTDPLDLGASSPLVPPLYQSSVYTLPSLEALDEIMNGVEPGYIYARDAHPNARHLADELKELERADWALVCGSGMAAISACVLASVQQGDRIVASNHLYGKTTQLLRDELARFGVLTEFVDTSDPGQVQAALERPARLLFVETMSNPLLRLADLPALIELAHERNCVVAVDNTFATPALLRPVALGADLVVESLTKMIGGHSDVTLGLVCGRGDAGVQVGALVSTWGFSANPFDCWLGVRGLPTLPLRMRAASENASVLASWLAEQSAVARVVYPGRADHPDHDLADRLLGGCFGNVLCFELHGGRSAVNRLVRRAPAIAFSPSLGHVQTTLSHPATTSHRYVSPGDKRRQGITEGLVRLSVGVEDVAVLRKEMARGLG